MRFEQDELELLGGIRHGRTLGFAGSRSSSATASGATGKWNEEMFGRAGRLPRSR